MSSIDDTANGTEQTRYHRNPPEECGRAVRLICSYAHDAADARELCTALGLNPRDGRRKAQPRSPSIPGRPSIRAPLSDTSSRRPIGLPQREFRQLCVASTLEVQHKRTRRGARVIFDAIEWDEHNLDRACRRVSTVEIEQVITNATSYRRHQRYPDRVLFTDRTDGGKRVTVVARYDAGHHIVRPITAWEEP